MRLTIPLLDGRKPKVMMAPPVAEVRSSTPCNDEAEEAMEMDPLNTSVTSSGGGPLNRSAISYMLRDASENSCILVVGSTGTGKSATIAKLTGNLEQ